MPLTEAEITVVESIRGRAHELRPMLAELVAVNSWTANHEGVNEVGQLVERQLLEAGLRSAAFVTGVSGQHLIGRTDDREGNRLMLLGHLDTVFPPIEGAVSELVDDPAGNGRVLGPGATDMKGGLVVMLAAIRALADAGELDGRSLTAFFCADEEAGSPTGRDLIADEAGDHHLCLVFEPGTDFGEGRTAFVTSRRGFARLSLKILGEESHAGVAKEAGLSAALEAAHKIIDLEALNDPERGATVNVGVVESGTGANVVPGEARLEIDLRFDDEEVGEELLAAARAICERRYTANAEHGLEPRIEITEGTRAVPMPRTDAIGRMAARIIEAGDDLGLDLVEQHRGGASDGNVAADAGCPVVDGLGSVGGRYHSAEEWVHEPSLVDRACLLAVTMMRFYRL